MPKIFLTADTHFGHSRIIQFCRRPFASIDEMDDRLIRNWNSVVSPTDHVWHLGDFAFRKHEDYIKQLNGKLHLLLGNHDKFSKAVRSRFFEVRDLFHGKLTGDKDSPLVFLFHYPVVSWPKKGHGCIHFYGHVHGRYNRLTQRSLDVGVDVHKFTPIELSEAIKLAQINYDKTDTVVQEGDIQTQSNSVVSCAESPRADSHADSISGNDQRCERGQLEG